MARILVVDDEALYCENLEFALSAEGHQVWVATTLCDAISVGDQFHPEILICDWLLGDGLTGYHVLDPLHSRHPRLRSILITGMVEDGDDDLDPSAFDQIIRKPFTTQELLNVVDELIGELQLNR